MFNVQLTQILFQFFLLKTLPVSGVELPFSCKYLIYHLRLKSQELNDANESGLFDSHAAPRFVTVN